ncbi:MAG: sugar ABC transporter permease [Actinobacteria bacterium]|nr:sugar ABC transporter permease [Actinomycetota bacterium]
MRGYIISEVQLLRERKRKNFWPYVFASPFLILYFVFLLVPTLFTIYLSFNKWNGINPITFVGLKNYIFIFTRDPYFFKSILNIILIMLMYIPAVIVLGVIIAAAITNRYLKWGHAFRVISCLPYITMSVGIGLIFALILDPKMGVLNRVLLYLGLIKDEIQWLKDPYARYVVVIMMIWRLLGYMILLYSASMVNIPAELYEAASIDGANGIGKFRHITLPLIMPTTRFLIITSIIAGFQLVEEPLLLLNGWTSGSQGGGFANAVKSCNNYS